MPTSTFVGRDGLHLVADVLGPDDGPPVILLHGGGQTRHSWHGTATTLADRGWRAVSLDMRGHGESHWDPEGDYSLDAFAGDIALVAETLRPPAGARRRQPRRDLVDGRDRRLRRRYCSRLVAHPCRRRAQDGGLRTRADRHVHAERARRLRVPRGGGRCRGRLQPASTTSQGSQRAGEEPAPARGRSLGLALGPEVHHGQVRLAGRDPLVGGRPRPARRRCRLADPAHAARPRPLQRPAQRGGGAGFLDVVPHARFADVDGAGHMVAGDRNEVFNKAILEFLADNRPD